MSFLVNSKIAKICCRAVLFLAFSFQICSGFSTVSFVACPVTFGGAKCQGVGKLLRNGCAFSLIRRREPRSRRPSSLDTHSALASPELTHLLKEYGVPAVLTHACGWFVCMVALFSASSSGLDTDVLISYLPATFQVEFPIFFRNAGEWTLSDIYLFLAASCCNSVFMFRNISTVVVLHPCFDFSSASL
jgi:hypothetical protein